MHRDFKRLLKNATGESEFVLALNVDIRGFSAFSMTVDSSETAMYVKRVYAEIIREYFPSARFFKPTGDGLVIVEGFTERTLGRKVDTTVSACLRLLRDFPSLATKDPMINFEVPTALGIGATRGAACRLVSGEKTLDYSGRVLNLASRLMGLARPSGLVFDSAFGPELLRNEVLQEFESETVFLKGIAEDTPVTVFYSTGVQIDESAKHPLHQLDWLENERKYTLKQIKDPLPTPTFTLDDGLHDPGNIQVKVETRNPKRPGATMVWDYVLFEYLFEAGKHKVTVDPSPIPELVKKWGIWRNDEKVTIRILYPARPGE